MFEHLPDILGSALRDQRAGLDQITFNLIDLRAGTSAIKLESLAFADHAPIPVRYTADGEGISPPLNWSEVPAAARMLVLIVEDADSPTPHPLVHAIVVGLDAPAGALPEGALDSADHEGTQDVQVGRNSLLGQAWLPPDPPPGHGVHRYAFQLFALAEDPGFSQAPGREELYEAIRSHGLASGLLIGTYTRDTTVPADRTEESVSIAPGGLAT